MAQSHDVKLESVNDINPEEILRYLEWLLIKRYQEGLYARDYYKGPKHSKDPLMGAHNRLNNAAAVMVGNLAKQIGVNIYEYSRGNPNKPDTRSFLSGFEDQGIVFNDEPFP